MSDALHFHAHAAGAASYRAYSSLEIGGRKVGHLGLGDLLEPGRESACLPCPRAAWGCPLAILMAFMIKTAVGGVLMMKVKLLS